MPRTMKLEGLNALILLAIDNGCVHPSKIAIECKVKPPYISLHLDTLERYGYVKRSKKGILVEVAFTPLGVETVKVLKQKAVGINQSLNPVYYRVHDIALSMKLKDPVQPASRQELIASSKLVAMNNHVDLVLQQEGYKARLYPNSLTVYLPDISIPLSGDLELTTMSIMDKLEEIVPRLEAKLNVKVIRLDKNTLKASLVNMHIALTNHKFAEEVNDKGEKLYVFVDDVLRVVVDKSHGLNEYEAVAPAFVIEDASRLGKLTKAVIKGDFDYEKEQQLRELDRQNIQGLTSIIIEQNKFFVKHNAMIEQITKLVKDLRDERKQRRL